MRATARMRGWYRFIVRMIHPCVRQIGSECKGNFNQTAGSIASKLEKNIRFLIETTLPKMCRHVVALLPVNGVKSVRESVPVSVIRSFSRLIVMPAVSHCSPMSFLVSRVTIRNEKKYCVHDKWSSFVRSILFNERRTHSVELPYRLMQFFDIRVVKLFCLASWFEIAKSRNSISMYFYRSSG